MSKLVDYDGRVCQVVAHRVHNNTPDSMQVDEGYDLKDVKTFEIYKNVPRWRIVSATATQERIYRDQRLN